MGSIGFLNGTDSRNLRRRGGHPGAAFFLVTCYAEHFGDAFQRCGVGDRRP